MCVECFVHQVMFAVTTQKCVCVCVWLSNFFRVSFSSLAEFQRIPVCVCVFLSPTELLLLLLSFSSSSSSLSSSSSSSCVCVCVCVCVCACARVYVCVCFFFFLSPLRPPSRVIKLQTFYLPLRKHFQVISLAHQETTVYHFGFPTCSTAKMLWNVKCQYANWWQIGNNSSFTFLFIAFA